MSNDSSFGDSPITSPEPFKFSRYATLLVSVPLNVAIIDWGVEMAWRQISKDPNTEQVSLLQMLPISAVVIAISVIAFAWRWKRSPLLSTIQRLTASINTAGLLCLPALLSMFLLMFLSFPF